MTLPHSYSIVKRSFAEYNLGQRNLSDEPRSGRFIELPTHEIAKKIHRIFLEGNIKLFKRAEVLKISKERSDHILSFI